jgi:branched-chain amino acid aminotransferase
MESSVVNAKAGCLYPNNARMLAEVRQRGFGNALAADAMGNVAESATANVFMVKDGEIFTPIANGTFLAGITRARHMSTLRANGYTVHETVLSFEDFEARMRSSCPAT